MLKTRKIRTANELFAIHTYAHKKFQNANSAGKNWQAIEFWFMVTNITFLMMRRMYFIKHGH